MTDTQAGVIAGKLTKAQREAIFAGYAWSGQTRLALWKFKLVSNLHDGFEKKEHYLSPKYLFRLTPLGLAVREHLKDQPHD